MFEFVSFEDTEVYDIQESHIVLVQEEPHYSGQYKKIYLDYEANVINIEVCTDKENEMIYENVSARDTDAEIFNFKFKEFGVADENDKPTTLYNNMDEYCSRFQFERFSNSCIETIHWVHQNQGYTLRIGSDEDVIYVIDKNNSIVSVLNDPEYGLQGGDAGTRYYVFHNGNLMVWNMGDVWSVVIIRQLDGQQFVNNDQSNK